MRLSIAYTHRGKHDAIMTKYTLLAIDFQEAILEALENMTADELAELSEFQLDEFTVIDKINNYGEFTDMEGNEASIEELPLELLMRLSSQIAFCIPKTES